MLLDLREIIVIEDKPQIRQRWGNGGDELMHLARKAFVLNQLLVANDNQAGVGDASPLGDHLRGDALAKRVQVSPHDWLVDWLQ